MFKLLAKSRQLAAELMDSLSSVCPGCNRQGKIVRRGKRGAGDNSRYTIRCSFRFCRKETALWAGTPLYRARIEPEELIVLLDLWLHKLNIRQLSYLMDMSRKAIRRILSKVADIIVPRFYKNFEKIGGEGVIVEIDESKFGKRKNNRGHRVDGVWVLGMIERSDPGRIYLSWVSKRKEYVMRPIIVANAVNTSTVYTDGFRAYNTLSQYFPVHGVVNHNANFVDPETGVHTNTIEGHWCSVKEQIAHKHMTKNMISLYMVRYMLLCNSPDTSLRDLINNLFYLVFLPSF